SHETGVVLCDRLPCRRPDDYLADRFSRGIEYENETGGWRELWRQMHIFGTTGAGMSHVASAVDIVLGSFRYALDDRTRGAHLMEKVAPLIWGEEENGVFSVIERGLILRPLLRKIRVQSYRDEYDELRLYVEERVARTRA